MLNINQRFPRIRRGNVSYIFRYQFLAFPEICHQNSTQYISFTVGSTYSIFSRSISHSYTLPHNKIAVETRTHSVIDHKWFLRNPIVLIAISLLLHHKPHQIVPKNEKKNSRPERNVKNLGLFSDFHCQTWNNNTVRSILPSKKLNRNF